MGVRFSIINLTDLFSPLLHLLPMHCNISINNEKKVPETKGVEEGSAKRNITRRHDHDPHRKEKKQGGGGGGKGKWNPTDDGTF